MKLRNLLVSGLVLTSIGVSLPVQAYTTKDGKRELPTEYDPKDPAGWNQNHGNYPMGALDTGLMVHAGVTPPPSKITGNYAYIDPNHYSLYNYMCATFCFTKMLIQSKQVPIGTEVRDIHDKAYNNKWYRSWETYHISWENWNFEGKMKFEGFQEITDIEQIKDVWRSGKYVIINVKSGLYAGHYITLDYVTDDGKVVISDSASPSHFMEEAYIPNARNIKGIVVFSPQGDTPKSTEGISITQSRKGEAVKVDTSKDFPDGTEVGDSSEIEKGNPEDNDQVYYTGGSWEIMLEDDLPNMPTYRDYLEKYGSDQANGDTPLLTEEGFNRLIDKKKVEEDFANGTENAVSIENWRMELANNKRVTTIQKGRRSATLVGLSLAGFSTFLFILYILARVVPAVDRFVTTITRGKVVVVGIKEELEVVRGKGKAIYLTDLNIFGYVGGILIVSLLFLSGLGYQFLDWFLNFVSEFWNGLGNLFR